VAKEEFIPKWIAWEVTGRCNLNCIHCRASSSMVSHDTDFTTEEARKLIDDITSFCSPVLVLSGGEPLCARTSSRSRNTGPRKAFGCASPPTGRW